MDAMRSPRRTRNARRSFGCTPDEGTPGGRLRARLRRPTAPEITRRAAVAALGAVLASSAGIVLEVGPSVLAWVEVWGTLCELAARNQLLWASARTPVLWAPLVP